jgi:beta-glucanase (GH16 family)
MGKSNLFKILIGVELIGMIIFFVAFVVASLKGEPIPHNRKIDVNDSTWNLVFNDEFDALLDLTKWKVVDFNESNHLRRAGFYSNDNVFVENGNLVIRTNYQDNGLYGKGWYTGWVETSKNTSKNYETPNYVGFNAKGGYFETRAIVPNSVGIWSAFWMMPDNNDYGSEREVLNSALDGAEIDIMESPYKYLGGIMTEKATPVVHADEYSSYDKLSDDYVVSDENNPYYEYLKSYSGKNYYVPNMYTKYHTYGVEWSIDTNPQNSYIRFYIDSYMTFEVGASWAIRQLGKSIDMLIPEVYEYLLLSVEVGGTNDGVNVTPGAWCGNPDVNDKSKNYDFLVDYVRVYQKK